MTLILVKTGEFAQKEVVTALAQASLVQHVQTVSFPNFVIDAKRHPVLSVFMEICNSLSLNSFENN